MTFTNEQQLISEYYIAALGRAPETEGLDYWVSRLNGTNTESPQLTIDEIRNFFFDRNIPEVLNRFPLSQDTTVTVNNIYQNVFGRSSDQEGLEYWSGRLSGPNEFGQPQLEENELISQMLAIAKQEGNEIDGEYLTSRLQLSESIYYSGLLKTKTLSNINLKTGELSSVSTQGVSALDSKVYWDDSLSFITYGYNSSIPSAYYGESGLTNGWTELSFNQKTVVDNIIKEVNEIIDLKIIKSNDALINFNIVDMPSDTSAFAYYPGQNFEYEGDIFLSSGFNSSDNEYNYGLNKGEFGWSTIVHELGHALGLEHPFSGNVTLPSELDNTNYSIMSYTSNYNVVPVLSYTSNNISLNYEYLYSDLFSLFDVSALQYIYGANKNTNLEDNIYTTSYLEKELKTIWDAGGVDFLDFSDTVGKNTVDLRSGTLNSVDELSLSQVISIYQKEAIDNNKFGFNNFISENITDLFNSNNLYTGKDNFAITTGTIIENIITGSNNDVITDNHVNNFISTQAGNDTIHFGNGGSDFLDAGSGLDTMYLDVLFEDVNITKNETSYTLKTDSFEVEFINVENIALSDEVLIVNDLFIS